MAVANQNALENDARLRFKQTEHPHARAVVSSTSTGVICADELPTEGADSNLTHHVRVVTVAKYLELVGIVLVEEGNWDAHDALVVAGNFLVCADLDCIVVFVAIVRGLSS